MRFINVFRLFRGYVCVRAEGGFPDKFLNDLKKHNINVFDIQRYESHMIISVFAEDYRLIHDFRKNSSMKLRIVEKHGLPFQIFKRRNRFGLIIGFIIGIILLYYFSGSVLTISVEGVNNLYKNKVLEAFQKNGVYIGARTDEIDAQTVCENVLGELTEFSWISFSRSGTNGVIKVKEAVPIPEVNSFKEPCNVIAKCDGQIVKMEPFSGRAEVKVGSAVVKGDLLISGVVDLSSGMTMFDAADGNVLAKTEREISSSVESGSNLSKRTEIIPRYRLNFLGKKFGLTGKNNGFQKYVEFEEILVPVGIETSFIFKTEKINLPREKLYLICLDKLFNKQLAEVNNENIKSVKIKDVFTEDKTEIIAKFTLIEDICEYKYIEFVDES
ncbi:MAG: sporulation protein YqfD [Oscillospiraceae bacterium]|nr:sporulation protein YqfD [Oscillospiraceae bacterium]